MKIGQEGDTRRFKKPYLYDVTKDIKDEKARWPRCVTCGEQIKGLKVRVAEGKYVCLRCYDEGDE